MESKNYYLGLDIGTDSVGYAVTDEEYNLLKFHGEPAWGVTVFDAASLATDRRSFRTARRRLDRRQQRIVFLEELFAPAITEIDKRFFIRRKESYLFRDEAQDTFPVFNDVGYTDKEYYKKYPTVHHLISELMRSNEPHDVRLVFIALAWLVKHRGHFLNNIDKNNLSAIKDFGTVYADFLSFFIGNEYDAPWERCNDDGLRDALGAILKKKQNISGKTKSLTQLLFPDGKPGKVATEDFPFSREGIVKLLAGATVKLKDLFCNEEYDEFGSVSLGMDDDKMGEIMSNIGDDFDLIASLRLIYDWAVLVDVLGEYACISDAKVAVYEQHKEDLELFKRIIRTYKPDKYNEMFRVVGKDNYPAYVYHTDEPNGKDLKKKNGEAFAKFVLSFIKDIEVAPEDADAFADMKTRLELGTFLPKQKNTDNRIIPHQLYWYELHCILEQAKNYLPFLSEKDESGFTIAEKAEKIFLFRIPYFVGPLNKNSPRAWLERNEGRITPWNFENMVDLDASEQKFIEQLTNYCSYLPGETVLPKDSLLYHRFTVLNEINNIRINGERIPVEVKQRLYNEKFMQKKKVTKKAILEFLVANGVVEKGKEDSVTGLDETIKSNLAPQIAFKRLTDAAVLSETDVERIIERASYAEDKTRLSKWLEREYPRIGAEDRRYICHIKIKDFGRLSRRFLAEFEGADKATGEVMTVIGALWNTSCNLMEIIADTERFTFKEKIDAFRADYYTEHSVTLEKRMDEMYLSNAVRRPVYRTLDIVKDITKAFGEPKKIFVEMTRGANPDQKGKRTKSRKQQILELYAKCKNEDVRLLKEQLEAMGEYAENKLQGDKLFLYYMQLGKCMYTKEPIILEKLGTEKYNIDHIYPQAFVKDDSIINNKVLVLSEKNGAKGDVYPIEDSIRHRMKGYWEYLQHNGLISDEKYKRLVRSTPFTEEEKYSFINRQITETSQSTKAVATLLKEKYPNAEIVYSKARLTSEFRQEFNLFKCRSFNDLHHAADAYLNIVTGNVYNSKFTKNFSVQTNYSIKTKTVFTNPVKCGSKVVWNGTDMLAKVKKTAVKNTAHFTKYAFFKKGGLFDQNPVPAAEGLTPLKKGLDTAKYGGYNKAAAMFYIPVRYKAGKKSEILIMSVELLQGDKFLKNEAFAKKYSFDRLAHIIGKPVDSVEFPLGMRPWKVNTVLSLDGFRVCIAGISSGGKCLVAQPIMQFSASADWQSYLKKLERLAEKAADNEGYIFNADFDKVTKSKNAELYDLYIEKLRHSIYAKRVNNPVAVLEKGKEKFLALDEKQQAKALLNIQQVFGRIAGGIDLTLIGGAGKAAATISFSATMSNWKKLYSDVRIIDPSPSGLWKKTSENLLELL